MEAISGKVIPRGVMPAYSRFCNNNAVGERLDTANTLEASAGCHRILHNGVQSYMLKSTLREFLYSLINILICAKIFVDRSFSFVIT